MNLTFSNMRHNRGNPANDEASNQGRVVVNVTKDVDSIKQREEQQSQTKSNGHILPYGSVLTIPDTDIIYHEYTYKKKIPKSYSLLDANDDLYTNDHEQFKHNDYDRILSAFNGLCIPLPDTANTYPEWVALTPEEKRDEIHKHVQFSGLAGTSNRGGDGVHGVLDLVLLPAAIGGFFSVINSGPKVIESGATLMVRAPTPPEDILSNPYVREFEIHDTPLTKAMWEVVEYSHDQIPSLQLLQNHLEKNGELATVDEFCLQMDQQSGYGWSKSLLKGFKKAGDEQGSLRNAVEVFKMVYDARAEANSRIIGRAMQSATSGHQFDMMLGRGYCI